jgi:N-acetyl-gamma-glutamyl-phosphate reductase
MIKVAIVGASGYTGLELIRLLLRHPEVEITCITSRQNAGSSVSSVFPTLLDRIDLIFDPVDIDLIVSRADFIFTALPHKAAMEVIPGFLQAGKKVVDLSADYRLGDVAVYEQWYQPHSSPDLVAEAAYGLPEIFRSRIRGARLVANPGCYPTSVALALAPLIKNELIDLDSLIVDSKSGASGAGRSAKLGSLYCEVNEGFKAYGVGAHRHTPEIEQTLGHLAGKPVVVSFTPHLLPINRGILSTCYATLTEPRLTGELVKLFQDYYRDEKFVRIHPEGELPNVAFVRGSNYCNIGLVSDPRTGRVIVVSVIDNLLKGASGQAVQNMNLMQGWDEGRGLEDLPLYP